MLIAAAKAGCIDLKSAALEIILSFRRAGISVKSIALSTHRSNPSPEDDNECHIFVCLSGNQSMSSFRSFHSFLINAFVFIIQLSHFILHLM